MSRRGFLIGVGRYGLAALLVGGMAALLGRHGTQCLSGQACAGCAELALCELPQALSARKADGRGRETDA